MISPQDILILLIAFVSIWLGSGLVITAIDKLAGTLKHSSFIISFFVLGFFTSITEISVALNSLIDNTPQVSTGNLIGGAIVLLLFVIPLLGIFGKGIKLDHSFGVKGVLFCILVLLLPFVLLVDNNFNQIDGLILIGAYFLLSVYLYRKDGRETTESKDSPVASDKIKNIIYIILGITILLLASNYLVEEVVSIAKDLNISAFIISLLGLSIGTNMPEITLAIRSVIKGKTEVALGNYLGSAVFNMLILGVLGFMANSFNIISPLFVPLIFSLIGFLAFYFFMRSNNFLSRKESMILLLIYIIFVLVELLINF